MPSSSLSHRHKRPRQPSITDFFSPSSVHPPSPTPHALSSPSLTQWPAPRPLAPLPAHVQSSLMNVGMRIRKAVPEGYKTHKAKPIHKAALSPTQPAASTFSTRTPRPRELVPYCAINHVGNLDPQSDASEAGLCDEDLPDLLFPGQDDLDTPFSSQESRTSTATGLGISGVTPLPTTISGCKKRIWDDAEDEDGGSEDMGFRPSGFSGQLLSSDPFTRPTAAPVQLRPLAQPRSKRKSVASTWQEAAGGIKAPAAKGVGGPVLDDFEEADFFREENWIGEEMEF